MNQEKSFSKPLDFAKQIFAGKTLGRILLNWEIAKRCQNMSGVVVDLAGGGNSSYYQYLPKSVSVVRTNYKDVGGIDRVVDLNGKLPFESSSIDSALLFNALYIVQDRSVLLKEIHRILKPGGQIFVSMPFIYNEMREPDDFCRLTYQGLETEFTQAGFDKVEIKRLGERFSSVANLLHPVLVLSVIRFFVYSLSLVSDFLIPRKLRDDHPTPIEYFCVITK